MAEKTELKRTILHYAFRSGEASEDDLTNIKKFIEKIKNVGKSGKKAKVK